MTILDVLAVIGLLLLAGSVAGVLTGIGLYFFDKDTDTEGK